MNTPDKIKIKLNADELSIFSGYTDLLIDVVRSQNKPLDFMKLNEILLTRLSFFLKKKLIPLPIKPITFSVPSEQAISLYMIWKISTIRKGAYQEQVIQKIINQIHKEVIV